MVRDLPLVKSGFEIYYKMMNVFDRMFVPLKLVKDHVDNVIVGLFEL